MNNLMYFFLYVAIFIAIIFSYIFAWIVGLHSGINNADFWRKEIQKNGVEKDQQSRDTE